MDVQDAPRNQASGVEESQQDVDQFRGVFRVGDTCSAGEVKQPFAETQTTTEATED